MRTKTATAITAVKHEMHLQEWTAQIEARQASGMTVQKWCEENGINQDLLLPSSASAGAMCRYGGGNRTSKYSAAEFGYPY